jgi:TonB family protein
MPHALLLSPDDQAVSAITAVLEEMSVTCERPMDGPSAAKKLNSQSFDLVLVDCENLPAAKLIFDVCRRSQTGTNPVPIAIVDGRAGLPTAFRLGAELILTKPVAKDQARTTIRTAVSRVKKDDAIRPVHPLEETPAPAVAVQESQAQAAAAGASSAHSASEMVQAATPAPIMASAASADAKMSAAVEQPSVAPAVSALLANPPGTKTVTQEIPETDMFMPPAKAVPAKPSDDPILADLESDSPTAPVFSSYPDVPEKKGRGSLYALLTLLLLGGGLYAAWMYQPGFREFAQPQIDKVMGMVTGAGSQPQATAPRPVSQPTPAKVVASQPAPAAVAPASDSTAVPAASASTSNSGSTPVAANSAVAAPPAASSTTAASTASPAPDTSKPQPAADSKKSAATTPAPETELPGEKTAVILSSQGAEKRLIRHLPPAYPAEARKAGIEGTVVLKTVVNENGTVEGVRLVEGNAALAAAAITSVKQWHYRPYVRDGKAQPFQTIVLVEFQRP